MNFSGAVNARYATTDPKLSMYSNWQTAPPSEAQTFVSPKDLLALYDSKCRSMPYSNAMRSTEAETAVTDSKNWKRIEEEMERTKLTSVIAQDSMVSKREDHTAGFAEVCPRFQ